MDGQRDSGCRIRGNDRGNKHVRRRERYFFTMIVCLGPPHTPALEVTGDLNKEERRAGMRGNDLGAGVSRCGGGVDKRLRAFPPAFPVLSSARHKSRGN
jgi:hypothetical protein